MRTDMLPCRQRTFSSARLAVFHESLAGCKKKSTRAAGGVQYDRRAVRVCRMPRRKRVVKNKAHENRRRIERALPLARCFGIAIALPQSGPEFGNEWLGVVMGCVAREHVLSCNSDKGIRITGIIAGEAFDVMHDGFKGDGHSLAQYWTVSVKNRWFHGGYRLGWRPYDVTVEGGHWP